MIAHLGPAHALLDRLAAPGPGGDLPVGMKSEQLAAAKHPLRLLGRTRDEFLHQHLVSKRSICVEILRVEVSNSGLQLGFVTHKPDATAAGPARSLYDRGTF